MEAENDRISLSTSSVVKVVCACSSFGRRLQTQWKKLKRLQSHGCLKCLRMDKEADERIYRSRHIGMENPFERIRMRWDESKCNHTLIVCIIINDTHNKQSQSRINQSSTYPLRLKYKCYSIQSSLMALLLTRCPSSTL